MTYYSNVIDRVRALPGVAGATWTSVQPLVNDLDREGVKIDGYTPAPKEKLYIEWNLVGPQYHEVLGIPIVSGRGFNERDGTGDRVVIINETTARKYFAGRSAIGSYMEMMDGTWQIIGVVRDAKYHALNEDPRPYMYLPLMRFAGSRVGAPNLIVRTSGSPSTMLPVVVNTARAVDPVVPVFGETTMANQLRATLAPQLAGAWLLGAFAALALVVAAVGIYGIVAYTVSHRTRELGIRMALGAAKGGVVRLVVGSSLGFVALGIPIGLLLAAPMAKAMTEFLFGVESTDAVTFLGMSLVMLVVGCIASYIPARRIVRIDPLIALRTDA
jgi:predicted permease